jgi:hypothetical protein
MAGTNTASMLPELKNNATDRKSAQRAARIALLSSRVTC